MRRPVIACIFAFSMFFQMLLPRTSGWCAEDQAAPATGNKGLQQRIDFGNAHILGQSIKSGAVYLMHRKKSDIKSMLEVRQHYREEIIEDFDLEQTAIVQGRHESDRANGKPSDDLASAKATSVIKP